MKALLLLLLPLLVVITSHVVEGKVVYAALRKYGWRKPNRIYGKGPTYFFRGQDYFRWNDKTDRPHGGYPKSIYSEWPGIPNDIDAAVMWLPRPNYYYFFKGYHYWKYDAARDKVNSGYPKTISSGWPGLPNYLDAAFTWKNGKTYFFKGDKYWRWNKYSDKLDSGYPKLISKEWRNVPNNIDAAVRWADNEETYFFKGNVYYKLGYPEARNICSGWKGLC
eukprot:m.309348 g.309348  ORF g.309348 m.309348 type:complete len:221 (+) comp46129_c0_seq1:139-801(+)